MGGADSSTLPVPSSVTMTALAANSNNRRSQIVCNNCKCRGHFARDCYWPGGGKEGQFPPNFSKRGRGGGGLNTSNSNITSANATKVFTLATHTAFETKTDRHSLLDSAATEYCFTSRGDFDQYSDTMN